MKTETIEFLQKQIINGKDRLEPYITDNEGKRLPKRNLFTTLSSYLDAFLEGKRDERFIVIPGLRGVGKTTLLAQSYYYLLEANKDINILYFSADEAKSFLNLGLAELIENYEVVLGTDYESLKKPTFIFIDEVQADENWGNLLKALYDKARNVFIMCSGSSAVHLQASPDVARRAIFEKLYPLNFCEYELVKNKVEVPIKLKDDLKDAIFFSQTAEETYSKLNALSNEVVKYWTKVKKRDIDDFMDIGSFPFALQKRTPADVYTALNSILDKIIMQDLQDIKKFSPSTLNQIRRLLYILATQDTTSILKLTDLIYLDRLTLVQVFDVLEKTELLIKIPPYGVFDSSLNKPSKYLFMSPSLRTSLLNISGIESTFLTRKGKLFEDIVGENFYREFINNKVATVSYDPSLNGADFILQIMNKIQICVEVGLGQKTSKQIRNTMAKVKCNYGVIISNSELELSEDKMVVKVPINYFILT